MTTAYISIAIPKSEKITSEKEAIAQIQRVKHWFEYNAHFRFHQNESSAIKQPLQNQYDPEKDQILIVQVEEVFTPDPHLDLNLSQATCIGALYQFGIVEEGVVKQYQPFSPQYRKLGLLKAYVDNQTSQNLEALLQEVKAKELHALVKMLKDDMVDKRDPQQLWHSLNAVEIAFVKQYEQTNRYWLIASILTAGFAYLVRTLFFSDSFYGFEKHTFNKNELEEVREGMEQFWDHREKQEIQEGFVPLSLYARDRVKNLDNFERSFTRETLKFNAQGELKTRLQHQEGTNAYEVIGSTEQIQRWLLFQQYGKQLKVERTVLQQYIFTFPFNETIKSKSSTTANKPLKVLTAKDSDRLSEEDNKRYQDTNSFFTKSTTTSRALVDEGKNSVGPFCR
jgi:hypothetical protein